ncbi:MAG: hypothetical protein JWM53_4337, partial [bacterium]|nr:hypothetical protein [bacterium]
MRIAFVFFLLPAVAAAQTGRNVPPPTGSRTQGSTVPPPPALPS